MRVLTDKEKRLRHLHPELTLIRPDASWQAAYMEQIDQGWHDYQHDVECLRDSGAFTSFIGRIDSGQSWNGTQECHVRWLVDLAARKILGRVRLKNIQAPASSPIWQDPDTMIGGHVGYSICPPSRGRGLSTLMLSLALDECFCMGLVDCFWWIYDSNEASIRTTLGCGAVRGPSQKLSDSVSHSEFRIELRTQAD